MNKKGLGNPGLGFIKKKFKNLKINLHPKTHI